MEEGRGGERLGHQRKVWKVEGVIEADGEGEMTKEERGKDTSVLRREERVEKVLDKDK